MKATISNIVLPVDAWINLYESPAIVAAGVNVGDRLTLSHIDGIIDVCLTQLKPSNQSGFVPLERGFDLTNSLGALGVWVISRSKSGLINASKDISAETPEGVFSGLRAMTTQSYTEANSKAGTQHEGSARFVDVAGGATNDTIFLTGALPVSLKGRVIGFTGDGVSAEIFESPTYTGGTQAVYQNASAINPVAGLSQIIVGASITDEGVLAFAPDYLIGNTSVQGKGTSGVVVGRENLLKPNTPYLFRLTSLDTQPQDIASLLTWYEGELDLPL